MKTKWTVPVLGVVVILFALFVWPTMYRYDKLDMKYPVRINRLTGTAYVLYPSGWQRMKSVTKVKSTFKSIAKQSPREDRSTTTVSLGQVKVNDIHFSGTTITCEVLNTSNKSLEITNLSFEIYDLSSNVEPIQPSGTSLNLQPNETHAISISPLDFNKKDSTIGSYKITVNYSAST